MSTRSTAARRCVGRTAFATALLAALAAAHSPAGAQYIVKDPFGLMAKVEQISKEAAEFGKQSQRWEETSRHYQQQLIKVQRLSFGQTQMEDTFASRPLDYGMEDGCPGTNRGIKDRITEAFQQAMPQLDGNVIDEQQAICQRMVYAENARYNESVQMLRKLMQRSREFAQIENQRDGVDDSQGALAANDNEAYRFVARNQLDLDYWQARMTAYDAYVAALKADHTRLARRAMRGKKSALDGIVPSDAIKSVLGN